MNYQTTMPDEKLIQFYLNGDPNAMATLVELYKDRVYRHIYNMVQNRYVAEEVFQETFICLINNMIAGKAAEAGNFLVFANRIAEELCLAYAGKKTALFEPGNIAEHKGRPVPSLSIPDNSYHESHGKIKSMIDLLPEKQREVLLLHHYGGLSVNEIAVRMKCTLSMTLDYLKMALNNLCSLMTQKVVALN